ncbi:molybdenum cofactor guanylyltransferase [Phenylobacterium terrae]|uniref:Molybdenum cofactor guanylyltransferase n=1 Tax=Phenylobacterium terrae TaxID=2665495 RepID=A0ABW4MVR7_9CAUL
MSLRLAAVVLAGGEGRRMGGSKPLRAWREGTLLEEALRKARRFAPDVAVAVRSADQVGLVDAPLLIDRADLAGPLSGLASAVAFAESVGAEAVLTAPCDAPLLPEDLAGRLAEALTAGQGVAMPVSHGQWQPACALWRSTLAAALADYAARGGRSLRGFAEEAGLRLVDWGAPEPDPFASANTPEDLYRLSRT